MQLPAAIYQMAAGHPESGERMKLAIVDSWFHWPPVGGAIRSIKEIAEGLTRRGVSVTVIAPGGRTPGTDALRFGYQGLGLGRPTGPSFQAAARSALRLLNPDAVMVGSGNLMKPYMIEAAKGFPTVVRLYAYELLCPASYGILFRDGHICSYNFVNQPYRCMTCTEDIRRVAHNTAIVDRPEFTRSLKFAYPLYHRLVRRSLSRTTRAVVTSQYMKDQFARVLPPERVDIVPDGVDSRFFTPSAGRKRSDYRVISLPGRTFDPVKGLDVLVRACALLWKKRQDFRLVVTGSGRPELKSLPFFAGDVWLDDAGIPGMYASSDIVVVPSVWGEPFGLTALEAMSCGVPVVASRAGGLAETVADGENGLLFEPGNHDELAARLDRLLDDPGLRQELGSEGRRRVVERYSWESIVDRYEGILEGVLKSDA